MSLFQVIARLSLVGLLAPAVAFAQTPPDPELVAQSQAAAERMRENRDTGLAEFVKDGMALLVIPTLNLDAGPKRDFNDTATRDKFLAQQSMLTRWNHKTDSGLAITVGHGQHKLDVLDTGPIFQTPHGKVTYQVIPVWPGEYQLDRITYHVPKMTIPRMSWHADTSSTAIKEVGMAMMRYRDDDVFKKTGPWSDFKKETDDGLGTGCQVVLKLGGGCDEAAREYRWQRTAQRAVKAGTAELDSAAGLFVDLTFDPIASIKLEAGEVVLTDGFVLMDGQPVLIKQLCEPGGDKVRCPVESLTVERLRTSVEDFRQAPSAESFKMPKLEGVLRDLVYRAPTLLMKPADSATPDVIRAQAK